MKYAKLYILTFITNSLEPFSVDDVLLFCRKNGCELSYDYVVEKLSEYIETGMLYSVGFKYWKTNP